MNTELPSKYDPSSVEAQAYQVWLDEKCFHADPGAPGESFCIVIPPPNVTGALHLGHAMNNTLQDILTRQHRMAGLNALWVPGIDHAGIATQAVVEKQLKEQENKTRHDVGREGLVQRIWTWKQQYGDRILEQLKRLGCSCDWDRTRFTLDEMCARAVRETFFKLFKDGLIYRGKRLVNWDTFLQTSISDDEIYHETVKTSLWHIRYPIEGAGEGETERQRDGEIDAGPGPSVSPSLSPSVSPSPTFMTVATTRPETMLGDTAVAVHSDDPRWNWAIGKHVRLPLTNRLIPIIADNILVDPKFGTGVVKVTPAHDPNDYAVWQRHKGQPDEIDLINILTPDGKITSDRPEWSKYAGMKRAAARTQVVEDLKAAGLLEKEEPYETQVGHSDRSKTPVEPYLSDQWFVKMAPMAEPALEVVREGKIQFYPERHAQQYLSWLGEKRDWPVSRQLWWGHRIPVWSKRWTVSNETRAQVEHELEQVLVASDDERNEQDISPTAWYAIIDLASSQEIQPDFSQPKRRLRNGQYDIDICALVDDEMRDLERLGFVRDPDVLDTWFSSALWPHSTLGWPEKTTELAKYYPTSVLLTGRDIITLWVARMVMMGMYNMGPQGGTGGPPVSSSADRQDHGRAARATEAPAPSPLYSGERAGVRGGTSDTSASQTPSASSPSPGPSPLSTGAREPEARRLGLPFLDVAINPTILDGKGERMSKSKGNGVDPVDIIDSYGADALRFTLTKMATETQDARMPVKRDASGKNTSEKFDEGRNFCNKLWNACRFALANLESVRADGSASPSLRPSVSPSHQTLADRWIISRFHRTVAECDDALKSYRFDVYAKSCYDFFWRDFCDWYVEAIKPAMKDPVRAAQTADVLAAVLDGSLRLMHPMIPFITETVWWRLNDVRPQRGLGELLPCPPSKRLVLAQWPTTPRFSPPFSPGGHAGSAPHDPARPPGLNEALIADSDDAAIIFPKLQEIISSIRTVRNDYQVNPKQTVPVSIKPPADFAGQIESNRELIELLAVCTLKSVQSDLAPVANAVTSAAAGCDIFVEGLIDPNAERLRLAKDIEAKKKSVEALNTRLGSASYVAKAPPHLVQQTRDQLAAAEAEVVKMEESLRKLG